MVKQITTVWNLPAESTQLLTVTPDDEPDSAQTILQFLRIPLETSKYKAKLVNHFNEHAARTHPIVVLVDEFVGSGQTMAKRIRDLQSTFEKEKKTYNLARLDIFVCVLAAMKPAKEVIENCGVAFSAQVWLNPGISGHYREPHLTSALDRMQRLESLLDQGPGEREDFHTLGYGGAETLYRLRDWNCPNSVFPLFWWRWLATGGERETILVRHMSQGAIKVAKKRRLAAVFQQPKKQTS